MGGLGRHLSVGKGCTPGYGLHGGEHGGAVTPIAGGLKGRKRSHRGHTSLTPYGRESVSHSGCTMGRHPHSGSNSHLKPYREGH